MSLIALFASTAFAAAPDVSALIIPPTTATVYSADRWQVKVSNTGNRDAAGSQVVIQLPITNTSPGVHVMGTVGAKSSSCTASGTKLTCSLGTIRKGKSSTVYFDISLPESSGTLDFSATASTTTSGNPTGNDTDTEVASVTYYSPTTAGGVTVTNRHCTGTNLEAFFECELYPSSITDHLAVFNTDGSVSIPLDSGYGGTWSISGDELSFEYTYGTTIVAEFAGHGVDDTGCWEGLTTFPGSSYVSPYEVCF
jgi:hypothetical protein